MIENMRQKILKVVLKRLKFLESSTLILAGINTHFWGTEPSARVVFDEARFGLYTTTYLSHYFRKKPYPTIFAKNVQYVY